METEYKLGRIVEHDPRSKSFAFNTEGIAIKNVTHQRFIPILDQGQIGSCTGNAGVGDINTAPFIQNPASVFSPDENGALKLYNAAQAIDGNGIYPPVDNGSSGLSIAKALKNAGLISGYQHTFTLNDALKALMQYPIITGTNWYSDMFHPDADGRVHPTGTIKGGHEYEAVQVDADNGRIWFCNSWGENWGVKGRFYLTWADYAYLLSQSGDVTVLFPPVITPPAPSTYIFFKPTESTGGGHTISELSPDLVKKVLDPARGISNVPYVISSGYRTVEENKAVGGVANSAHLKRLAVDILCTDKNRQAILKGLLTCGVPVFIEDAGAHIHVDIDSSIHPLGDMIISLKD